jgi:carbon storage regulator
MLVLQRKENQRILIGEDIVITVVGPCTSVRIGIDAPKSVIILREEVRDRIKAAALRDGLDQAVDTV